MSRLVLLVCSLIGASLLTFGCGGGGGGTPVPAEPHVSFNWTATVQDHQTFAQNLSWTTCATADCHGLALAGGTAGPSCFNATATCHVATAGEPGAPHGTGIASPALHGPLAKANQFFCRNCHGRPPTDFSGGFVADLPVANQINAAGACNLCHPSAMAHPTSWQGTNNTNPTYSASHRGVDQGTQDLSCALCHPVTGPGPGPVPAAPSCLSTTHTNADNSTTPCHATGPLTAPHPVDGSYLPRSAHGAAAKQDLTVCQACHAVPGTSGPGTNPRFNVPLGNLTNGCETCHPAFYAHPGTWAGPIPGTAFHYQAGNVANACTLCHGVNLDGVGGINAAGGTPGQSCLECHADVTLFNLNCSACHGYPPDGVTAEPRVAALGGVLVNHRTVAAVGAHDQCAVCHGVKSSSTGTSGHLSPTANYGTFNLLTGVAGDHWNGQINMNGPTPTTGTGYNATNFGCDNAGCHVNDLAHQLTDSALTVAFGDYGGGGGGVVAPHPLNGSFLLPQNHGPVARADLAACKACHGQATTTNPRYNVGIASAGGNGCEGCHNDFTAHPSFGTRENVHWYDVDWRHSNGTKSTFANACGMCHPGLGGAGSVGPTCTSCHVVSPVTNNTGCVSCHNQPPNGGAPAGNVRPNRSRNHSRGAHQEDCSVCHGAGFGPGNANHFDADAAGRANVIMTGDGTGITISQSATNTTCNGNCHGQNHSDNW
jgi:predicted CXXCH cytochrome family protein